MLPRNRLVLFPHGPSLPEAREKLHELLHFCGADSSRITDTRLTTIQRFIIFAQKFDDVKQNFNSPIFVLTKSLVIAENVIATRAEITENIPTLVDPLWIVFVDELENPFFTRNSDRYGGLNDQLDNAPIWFVKTETGEQRYLILTKRTSDLQLVANNAEKLVRWQNPFQREKSSGLKNIYRGKP